VGKRDYKTEVLKVISCLKTLYSLSEEEVIELFETIVPEYKQSKETSNGHFLLRKKIPAK
jgi:hypothetical protein